MSHTRELLSKYTKVKDEEDIPGNFTSVRGEYMDPETGKTGFYKLNGSFWGQPDLRELLASDILKRVGVPCADIQLVYDDISENDNGCLSMSILKPGEEFVEDPDDSYTNFTSSLPNFGQGLDGIIERDIYFAKKALPEMPPEFWEQRKDFLVNYIFASALLGNDDIKTDNCQIIYNSNDNTYRNPEYYDMGMSFSGKAQGRCFYEGKTDMDVLEEIYQKYPEKVQWLSCSIEENLGKKDVKNLLKDQVYDTLSNEERKRIWTELGDKLSFINRENEKIYGFKNKSNGFNLGHEELMESLKEAPIKFKDKASRFVTSMIGKLTERDDK